MSTAIHHYFHSRDKFCELVKKGIPSGDSMAIVTVDDELCIEDGPMIAIAFTSQAGGKLVTSQFSCRVPMFLESATGVLKAHPRETWRKKDQEKFDPEKLNVWSYVPSDQEMATKVATVAALTAARRIPGGMFISKEEIAAVEGRALGFEDHEDGLMVYGTEMPK